MTVATGIGRGGRRAGGRPKGSKNKKTREIAAKVSEVVARGGDPITFMLGVVEDTKQSVSLRLQAAASVAPSVKPRLTAIATLPPWQQPLLGYDSTTLDLTANAPPAVAINIISVPERFRVCPEAPGGYAPFGYTYNPANRHFEPIEAAEAAVLPFAPAALAAPVEDAPAVDTLPLAEPAVAEVVEAVPPRDRPGPGAELAGRRGLDLTNPWARRKAGFWE
jgi:hypothetical protein